jgi:chorismate synthase
MPSNTFGEIFRLTTFGESHGPAIGGIIDGCPAGLSINPDEVQRMLARRRPGQSEVTTPRAEDDKVEFLSGILEGQTIGTPIGFIIRNKDARPSDYDELKDSFRPSHADYTWETKFGIRDHRGGGRSSARETASRVVGGAIALQALNKLGITINAWVSSIGSISMPDDVLPDYTVIDKNIVRCAHAETAEKMIQLIEDTKTAGDSLGGIICCSITGVQPGLGEPVFDKLHAVLGKAILSINAVKGFEIGSGFNAAGMSGSRHNDSFINDGGIIRTSTNHSGGIQGGISNGNEIYFRTAFKPVSTIQIPQSSVNREGESITVENKGRHDPCVVPRAVPIVESMAAMVMLDFTLRNRNSKF